MVDAFKGATRQVLQVLGDLRPEVWAMRQHAHDLRHGNKFNGALPSSYSSVLHELLKPHDIGTHQEGNCNGGLNAGAGCALGQHR